MQFAQLLQDYFVLFMFWELLWKGLALWKSAKRNEVAWFVAILSVNSVGVLPITYLIYDRFLRQKSAILWKKIASRVEGKKHLKKLASK